MKGGTVPLMFVLISESPVTEPLVQVISGQSQWVEVEFQWLMGAGSDQYCFSFNKIDCSELVVVGVVPWKGKMRKRRESMERGIFDIFGEVGFGWWLFFLFSSEKRGGGQAAGRQEGWIAMGSTMKCGRLDPLQNGKFTQQNMH